MRDADTAIDFVKNILRQAFWEAWYHDKALANAYKQFSFAKEMMESGGFIDIPEGLEEWCEDYDCDEEPKDFIEFLKSIVTDKIGSVEHHQNALQLAHAKLAFAKTLIARGNYAELDIDAIRKDAES